MTPSHDTTHTLIHAAKRFFGGTLLSRASGLLRDISIAAAFGTESALAAFMVAFRLAHLLRRLFGEGPMQSAIIPFYEQFRKEDPPRAAVFFRDLAATVSLVILLIIATGSSFIAATSWMGYWNESNQEIATLTLLMLPSLLFISLYGLHISLLQCHKSYFIPSFAPTAFNLVWILAAYFLCSFPLPTAMQGLSLAVVIACLAQWLITVPQALTIWKSNLLTPWWRGVSYFSEDVRRLIRPLSLGILGVASSQINSLCDAFFARYADAEGPAYLWYAIRIQQLPLALFGIALSSALLPPLARAIKQGESDRFPLLFSFAIRRATALMLPLSMGLIIMAPEIVNLIYGHGHFTDRGAVYTTHCLWGYTIGLLPMTLILVMAPAFYASDDYKTPALASVATTILNALLNTIAIFPMGFGAASVAYTTSLSAWINVSLLTYVLAKRDALPDVWEIMRSWGTITILSIVAASAAIFASYSFFQTNPLLSLCQGELCSLPRHFISQTIALIIPGITFLATLLIAAKIGKVQDINGWVSRG